MARPPRPDDAIQTDADAVNAITAAGYTNVTNLSHHGRTWHADATDAAGAPVVVVVHGRDGSVTAEADADDDAA